MTTPPTTIPIISPELFAKRLADNYPNGWASPDAKYGVPDSVDPASINGVMYNLLAMMGVELNFSLDESLQYAFDATRIPTGIGDALDLASLDFFGPAPTSLFSLPRLGGESDTSFSERIELNLLPTGATRQAVSDAIGRVTGFVPRIMEPWSPGDSGVWDGLAGQGMMFWDVDTVLTPFRWADDQAYQGFVECSLPLTNPFGNNPTPCYDVPSGFYWDVADGNGAWLIDPLPLITNGVQAVYNAINRTKVFGTEVWVKFVSPSNAPSFHPIAAQLLSGFPVGLGLVTDASTLSDDFGGVTDSAATPIILGTVP